MRAYDLRKVEASARLCKCPVGGKIAGTYYELEHGKTIRDAKGKWQLLKTSVELQN